MILVGKPEGKRPLGTNPTEGPEVPHGDELHPYFYSWRAHLFPDVHPLRMQFCELCVTTPRMSYFVQFSIDRRSMQSAQRPLQTPLGTGYSS
jgi:hypothetical protein